MKTQEDRCKELKNKFAWALGTTFDVRYSGARTWPQSEAERLVSLVTYHRVRPAIAALITASPADPGSFRRRQKQLLEIHDRSAEPNL